MRVVAVMPRSRRDPRLALNTSESDEFAFDTNALPDDDCPLCRIQCCIQRIRVSASETILVHGVLSEA